MRKLFLTLVVLLSVFSVLFAQTESDKLNKAYSRRSQKLLKEFFEDWQEKSKPISDSEYNQLNDTIKEAYKVFESFYNPKDLEKYGGSEELYGIYKNIEFAIIQNSVQVFRGKKVYYTAEEIDSFMVASVTNNPNYDSAFKAKMLKRDNGELNIMTQNFFYPYSPEHLKLQKVDDVLNFRPRISVIKSLYFLPKYQQAFDQFLILNTEQKRVFLENYIAISQGQIALNLVTFPTVTAIAFDENMRYVQVDFSIGSNMGQAYFKKDKNAWVFIKSEITGVY
jgi:hypothetical protein